MKRRRSWSVFIGLWGEYRDVRPWENSRVGGMGPRTVQVETSETLQNALFIHIIEMISGMILRLIHGPFRNCGEEKLSPTKSDPL